MSSLPEVRVPPDYQERGRADLTSVLRPAEALVPDTDTEAKHALKIVGFSADILSYTQGDSKTSPLEEDKIVQIKTDLESMKTKGIGAKEVVRVAAQSVSLIQAYTSLWNLVVENPIEPILPFDAALGPLASLVLKEETLSQNIEAWQKARGTDSEYEAFVKILGNIASCLLYVAQLIAFLTAIKISVEVQALLSTVAYAATLYDIIVKEYQGTSSERDEIYKPPVISMKV